MTLRKYYIQTFGCAMNQADSEKINMILLQSGFVKINDWKDADLVIFNTCSVRQKGEDRVFGMLTDISRENKKNKKNILVGITGCMVRKTGIDAKYLNDYKRDKNKAKNITLVNNDSAIFNNDDKLFPRSEGKLDFTLRIEDTKYLPLILTHILKEAIGNDSSFDDYLKSKQLRENPAQATIIIQTGCDNYCTFCIVPYTRGKENSRSIEDIVNEAKEAVKNGAKEITLVGQNVNSYGKQWVDRKYWNEEKGKWNIKPLSCPQDTPSAKFPSPYQEKEATCFKSPFRQLLDEINKIEGLDRIRFTSSNPHDMTQDILDAHFELDKMCNYLHFALQSGSDKMLKRMNRKHSYNDFKKMIEYLRTRDPYFSISTDIIVGYSGETEEMFLETVKAFEECEFDFVFNARYSVRKGTIAEKIYPDDISNDTKAERWHKLNDLLLESVTKRNTAMIGSVEKILISGEKDEEYFGRTRNFKEIYFPKVKGVNIGDLVDVKITELHRYVLLGEYIDI
ncbi:MAG: MiaB/RimO family radical SAM methylthiotransferase [Candidatus Gracilibacteria bacterium]|nr:MiaB/RimO family radical SAM methylthiotransferase [Candidatus Gracilibacteria bacterium]